MFLCPATVLDEADGFTPGISVAATMLSAHFALAILPWESLLRRGIVGQPKAKPTFDRFGWLYPKKIIIGARYNARDSLLSPILIYA